MTLLPTGDKGQRYEVRANGYPNEGANVIGWSDTLDGADKIASSIRLVPGCRSTTIHDRQGEMLDFTIWAGVLR